MREFANLSWEPVRDYWVNEAQDSIPWLAEQIDAEDPSEREDIIQFDLTLRGTERSVGRYNLDVRAEAEGGRIDVIENRLERSDRAGIGSGVATTGRSSLERKPTVTGRRT